MPFMMPDGELTTPIDINIFLNHVPFYCNYDHPIVAATKTTKTTNTE